MPHEIIMPALGMAQDTGVLVAWHKAPGDPVKAMDVLMEVETDKSTMEVEAGFDGYVTELRVAEGDEAPVGGVIAVISDSPDDTKAAREPGSDSASEPEAQPAPQEEEPALAAQPAASQPQAKASAAEPEAPKPATIAGAAPVRGERDRILASPKAKRLAHERGLDLRALVRQGVPQPYHVADLDRVEAAAPAVTTASPAAARASVSARIDPTAFQDFLAWAGTELGTAPAAAALWASFAAGALRRAGRYGREVLQIRTTRPGGGATPEVYRDPDLRRLGTLSAEPIDAYEVADAKAADLTLRDLSATRADGLRLPDDGAALMLTVARRDPDTLALCLDFTPGALDPDAAVGLLDDLARRAEAPLRHLL